LKASIRLRLAVRNVDVLIESTKRFEKDISKLSEDEKAAAIQKINDCASLFPTQKADVYRKLHRLPLNLNGYESSLYILRISRTLRVIWAVDEDPIFGQVIFTLFRVVKHDDLDRAYQGVAESLYQDILHHNLEAAQIS
jgi:mRNA-degrading endonuclease YafQ of YafQ-DinJ toxin-antitoxin module